jgi:asparagine synthase (glutamine-hydrolysing)
MLMVLGCWSDARSSVDCRDVTARMASFFADQDVPFSLRWTSPHFAVGLAGRRKGAVEDAAGFAQIGDIVAAGPAMLHATDPGPSGHGERDIARIARSVDDPDRLALLNGEFAVAIADTAAGSLTLVRDHFGSLPLYYSQWGEACAFSSLVPPLLLAPWATREPDKAALAAYLCVLSPGLERTYHRSVKAVLPASRVQVMGARPVHSSKYWRPEAVRPAQGISTAEEAYEAVGAELTRAVRQRTARFKKPVFMLSGGLDSSTVTAIHCAGSNDGIVEALSSVLPEGFVGEVPDERRYIELLAKRYPSLRVHYELADDADTLEGPGLFDCWAAGPTEDTFFYMANSLFKGASALDADALVTGEGGDFCVSMRARGSALVDFFLRARPVLFAREASRLAIERGVSPRTILRSLLIPPLVPLAVHRLRDRLRPPPPSGQSALSSVAAKDPDIAEHLARCGVTDFSPIRSMRDAESQLLTVLNVRGYTSFWVAAAASRSGLLPVSPLFDRPLVELVMSLPPQHKVGRGLDRMLIRGGGAPFLPEEIAHRPDKGFFSPDCNARWRAASGRLREGLTRAFRDDLFSELVDENAVRSAMDGIDAPARDKPAFANTTARVILPYFLARFLELRGWH